jgi:hypothetical protein
MCRSSGVDRAHGWGALTIPARITSSDQLGLLLVMIRRNAIATIQNYE